MADKKTYTQVVTTIETHVDYIRLHLKNLDSHLERINNRITEHDKITTMNKANINNIWRVIGGMGLLLLALIPILLKVFGVF